MPAQIWTPARRAKFLKKLAETGNVSAAARAAKASRSRAYQLKTEDAGFAEEWSEALEMATDALDAEARRRAMDGVDTPRFHQGQIAGTVKKYSDSLLMFLLRAHRPDLYRERTAAANSRQDDHDDSEDYTGARDALADRLARLDPDAGDGPDGGTDPAGGAY
ncbi:hypothetical protein [Thalassobaculum salexigens]|uniref:hypothetical protein n=1 Tax=Thalassobaculum salexigens TaxID=455360 RepID=UPI00041D9A87|nr:hypothetical protein [Thalassobaculum salexigens]